MKSKEQLLAEQAWNQRQQQEKEQECRRLQALSCTRDYWGMLYVMPAPGTVTAPAQRPAE